MKRLIIILLLITLTSIGWGKDVQPHQKSVVNSHVHYDHAVWNGIPIQFKAPVGQERILKFPTPVSVQIQGDQLTTDKVSMQNNNGYLYITAHKAFKAVRIPIKIKHSGKVILIDLSANKNASDRPVSVVMQKQSTKESNNQKGNNQPSFINYASLTRYAMQHLYAPKRLIQDNSRIGRTPMYTNKAVDLFDNNDLLAMPLISWQGGHLYVTAVLLHNVTPRSVQLNPRAIKGKWLTVSFYPNQVLKPHGHDNDTTTAFLVSDKPFNKALQQVRGRY